jgi:hypothetical protein
MAFFAFQLFCLVFHYVICCLVVDNFVYSVYYCQLWRLNFAFSLLLFWVFNADRTTKGFAVVAPSSASL